MSQINGGLGESTNGCLTILTDASNYQGTVRSSLAVASGKWYAEVTAVMGDSTRYMRIGTADVNHETFHQISNEPNDYALIGYGWSPYEDEFATPAGVTTSKYGQTFTTGTHVFGIALDMDNQTIKFYADGTLMGTETLTPSWINVEGFYMFAVSSILRNTFTCDVNFGQRPFTHAAPAGYKTLNTMNLP